MCFDVSYLRNSCKGYDEFLRVVGTGGMRSRLTGRSPHRDGIRTTYNSQGLERYVDPSNGSRRIDMVMREMWYKSS